MVYQRTKAELDDVYDIHDHTLSETLHDKKVSLPASPIVATLSEIEVIAPSRIVTPPQQVREDRSTGTEKIPKSEESSVEAIVTACSSTATEDMFDTVDDCVGCVNQISLQQEFEDELLDLPLELLDHPNGVPIIQSDDHSFHPRSGEAIKGEGGSAFCSNEGTRDSLLLEPPSQETELDLLNWCGGGYHGK
jgi:hypothetical protein